MAKKLLKYMLPEVPDGLTFEAVSIAGLVYDVADTIEDLPSKFFNRLMAVFSSNPEYFAQLDKNQRKLHSACLDKAIIKVMSQMETDDEPNCATYISNLLASNIEVEVSNALDIAMGDLQNESAKCILSYVQQKSTQTLNKKLQSSQEAIRLSKLPAEVLIHHEDEQVRLNALEALSKENFDQQTICRVLENEKSPKVVEAALELLDKENLVLRTDVFKRHKIGGDFLISTLKKDQVKTIAILFDAEKKSEILKVIGLKSILAHDKLDEIIDIMVSEKCIAGLSCIAASLTKAKKDIGSNSTVANRLLSVTEVSATDLAEVALELVKCSMIDGATKDKLAELAFRQPSLMAAFIKNQMKSNRKATAQFFADFGLRNKEQISGAITMVRLSLPEKSDDRIYHVIAAHAMCSADPATRQAGLQVLEKLDSNPISEKILKRTAEITADGAQFSQLINKVLKKQGPQNWPVLADLNEATEVELVTLFDILKPERIATFALEKLSGKLVSETDVKLLGQLCSFLGHQEWETLIGTDFDSLLSNLNNANGPTVVSSLLVQCINLDEKHAAFVEKVVAQAQIYAVKSIAVSDAVSKFVSEANSKLLSKLLTPRTTESEGSVIKAKRRRMSKSSTQATQSFEFLIFLLENAATRDVTGLADAFNAALEYALKSEGVSQDKIQSLIIGICSKTAILKPENLVEVVRRCSVCGPSNTEGDKDSSQINMTLIGALGSLSHLAKTMPDQVLNSLMSVFTFMGRGLLPRADDRYSFYAIQDRF